MNGAKVRTQCPLATFRQHCLEFPDKVARASTFSFAEDDTQSGNNIRTKVSNCLGILTTELHQLKDLARGKSAVKIVKTKEIPGMACENISGFNRNF